MQCNYILTVYGSGAEDLKSDIIQKKQRIESKKQLSLAIWGPLSEDMATQDLFCINPYGIF